ncbi:O-antigen ligase [Gluconobacter cerinus]|uniref:O-antigen ligase family protein n=1 Tax=Gluconobacter cerinus TaxID=38307 RepID=UPI002227832B|nr:O-antigen ligase family protein [Gluconobacter cerinus]MCW2264837.1 O-antigen ligase [Gluconobacter cerinus]
MESRNPPSTMSMRLSSFSLTRLGQWLAVLLPLTLTHLRGLAEADLDILAVLLLVQSARTRQWDWAREPWVIATFCWWGWQVLCTVWVSPGHGALGQSLAAIRFPLAAAALGCWLLRDDVWRRRALWITCGCGLYIAFQIMVQAAFGRNLFGVPRFHDGTLTGPYTHPRAAAPLSRLILPMLMLGCTLIEGWKSRWSRTLGLCAATVLAVAVMVLAGQRMPFALSLFGIGICALLYRPMRPAALVAAAMMPLLIFAASALSPGSFSHLVVLARQQLTHFSQSPYGEIYTHAVVMAQEHPLLGQGYDAYRHHCDDPATFHGLSWLSMATPEKGWRDLCVQHPHNHYLQALVNAGIPGLILFVLMVACWLKALWPGRQGSAIAIGLFAAVFIQEWPIASSSDFMNLPLGGWGFLMLGLGLAYRNGFQDTARGPIS